MRNFIFAVFFLVLSAANFASAAEIDRAYYLGAPDISYPVVIAKNSTATEKINNVIRAEVKKIIDTANKNLEDGTFNSVTINVDYQIPCNHDGGILSVLLNAYVNYEHSAHPSTFCYGLNFNSDSGVRLTSDTLTEIAKKPTDYTPADITAKLQKYAAQKGFPLNVDFQGLNEVPQNFYFDDNLHVHFVFQQYEVAAYAVGIIDLDADATY